MSHEPPVVPGRTLTRALGRSGLLYFSLSRAGDDETVEITDPAVRPSVVALALAAREQASQQRVTSEHLLRLREVVPLTDEVVALVRDAAGAGSLEDLVAHRGRLRPGEVTTLLTPLATTLAELDAAGVVHGSLHPGKVLFTEQGKPMLTGFETVRLVGERHRHPRREPSGFDAPEVALGALPTPASDAWSLGALGWYALTGQLPPPDAVDRAVEVVGAGFATALAPLLEQDPVRRTRAGVSAGRIYRAAAPVPLRLEVTRTPTSRDDAELVELVDDGVPVADQPLATAPVVAADGPRSDALVDDPWGGATRVRLSWGEDPDPDPPMGRPSAEPAPTSAPGGVDMRRVRSPLGAAPLPVGAAPDGEPVALRRWRAATPVPDPTHGGLSVRRRVLVLALALVVFVGAFVVVLARASRDGQAGAPSAAPSATAGASTGTVTGADPLAQGTASPAEILQGLVDARAAAISARDVARLDRAELPASPPHGADAALIARLTSAAQSFDGLRFAVRDVVVRTRADTRMELTAVVARDGYTLVGDGGARWPQPAAVGSAYGYQLTLTPTGWRLSVLTELAAPAPPSVGA
ncbi:MAG: protein kinase [Actinomycetota bacterium]|nr:protein kinase [Actinomycetota bacterium]